MIRIHSISSNRSHTYRLFTQVHIHQPYISSCIYTIFHTSSIVYKHILFYTHTSRLSQPFTILHTFHWSHTLAISHIALYPSRIHLSLYTYSAHIFPFSRHIIDQSHLDIYTSHDISLHIITTSYLHISHHMPFHNHVMHKCIITHGISI